MTPKASTTSFAERDERIRGMAKPNGTWSYSELAAEFGLSKARIGQIVRGESRPPKRLRP
jgi:transcriptional regulator with XRE-family HTH domain